MKLFNLILVWFSVVFVEVLSNNNSLGYELLYFYYVYKMEIDSGVTRTIAVGCTPRSGESLCYFDDFVKYLIDWDGYKPAVADHTTTPTDSVLKQLNNGMPASARYKLSALSTAIKKTTPMAEVLSTILSAANAAVQTQKVVQSDLQQAVAMSQEAKSARAAAIYEEQLVEFGKKVLPEAQLYLETFQDEFEWDEMLSNIDNDVESGKITQAQGEDYKSSIQQFCQNFGTEGSGAERSTITHKSVIMQFTDAINQLGIQVEESESSSGGSSPRAPSVECDADFIVFGADAKRKKRTPMLAKFGSGIGKGKPMWSPAAISANTGMRVLRFGSKF